MSFKLWPKYPTRHRSSSNLFIHCFRCNNYGEQINRNSLNDLHVIRPTKSIHKFREYYNANNNILIKRHQQLYHHGRNVQLYSTAEYATSTTGTNSTPITSPTQKKKENVNSDITTIMTIDEWKKSDKDKRHKLLDETLDIPTLIVPAQHIQQLLKPNSVFRPFLAMDLFEGIHPKVKMVHNSPSNDDDNDTADAPTKRLLLHPKCIQSNDSATRTNHDERGEGLKDLISSFPGIPQSMYDKDSSPIAHILNQCLPGPNMDVTIPYDHLPISSLLQKILPLEAHPPPVSFEIIGTVAHFNLKPHHIPYASLIGEVILERFFPQIRTIVNKVGEVGGPYRTYEMEIMACSNNNITSTKATVSNENMEILTSTTTSNESTETNPFWVSIREHSIRLEFDVRNVYWCTRLSGERQYLLNEEFKPNQFIADAFCGVGALCVHAAKKMKCKVVANDLNPDAVRYAIENAKRNGIRNTSNTGAGAGGNAGMDVTCGDARDFIRQLGRREDGMLPHHLIMNYPLASPEFLDALRWWPRRVGLIRRQKSQQLLRRKNQRQSRRQKKEMMEKNEEIQEEEENDYEVEKNNGDKSNDETWAHLYTFSKASAEDGRDVLDVAIDLVAEGLLVDAGEPGEAERFLNDILCCNVRAREVRDVAPGKAVICVSFRITDKLIRHMQGDFILS